MANFESGPCAMLLRLAAGAGSLSFNEQLRDELAAALRETIASGNARSIVLTGSTDSFLVGVELAVFQRAVEANSPEAVVQFTRRAHALLRQISQSPLAVTAWVQGPAVGAGVELALACRQIVASADAKFSLPETGLGIYPGMGGTQRLPRRIGVGLAKWMIYTGAILPADQALAIGLVDAVCPSGASLPEVIDAAASAATVRPQGALADRFVELERIFGSHTVAELLDPATAPSVDPQAQRALIQMRGKAPLALKLAEEIIDRGTAAALDDGLAEEIAHLEEIFATEDARTGLMSPPGTRITFAGR